MITIFCTMVLLVIQGVALNIGVMPFSKGRTLHIPRQSTQIIHILFQGPSTLPQTAEFILLHIHNARRYVGITKAFSKGILV
jgi:hypothetical protein